MILSYLSSAHLARAKEQLATGKPEALVYAALELRFAVESRLSDYSDLAATLRRNSKGSWSAKALAKHVDGVFPKGDFAYEITFSSPKLSKDITVTYTPVSARLKKIAARLGDYLHLAGAGRCTEEADFTRFRTLLEEGVAEMEYAASGELNGPPLVADGKTVKLSMGSSGIPELSKLLVGEKIRVGIRKLYPPAKK